MDNTTRSADANATTSNGRPTVQFQSPNTGGTEQSQNQSQQSSQKLHPNRGVEFAETNRAEQGLKHESSHQSAQSSGSAHRHHVVVDTRPMAHKYLIRRPRALQYYHEGNLIEPNNHEAAETENDVILPLSYRDRVATSMIPLPKGSDADTRSTDKPIIQRRRLDLFIDLLWVGIISNISETFTQSAFENTEIGFGLAYLEFLVLFLLAWDIWNFLREFLNDWFIDDIIQRSFILWTLVIALLYGNNAAYFTRSRADQTLVIALFLIARAGFAVREWVYSLLVPELRRMVLWNTLMSLPSAGLAVAAIYIKWPYCSIPLIACFFVEMFHKGIINSPIGDKLVGHGWKKAPDADHLIERLEGFFIIIIGEGVFLLIKNSPLGSGIGFQPGDGIVVLIIYWCLFTIYFNGDSSRNYIHAVRRSWWGAWAWTTLHIPLYTAVLLADASLLYLIQTDVKNTTTETSAADTVARTLFSIISRQETTTPESGSEPGATTAATETAEEEAYFHHVATWTAAATLAIALLTMTILALTNRTLDRPKTLLVNNRFLRLLPRILLIPIILCLPIKEDLQISHFLNILMALLLFVIYWEFAVGLEKGAKILEPKPKKGEALGSEVVEKRGLMEGGEHGSVRVVQPIGAAHDGNYVQGMRDAA